MVTIYYNGIDPFSGISQTPFVVRSESPFRSNHRQGIRSSLVFEGQITGSCTDGFSGMYGHAQTLVSRFSKNFQDLVIVDSTPTGDVTVFSGDVIVRDINFGESNFYRILPFSISLDYYENPDGSSDLPVIDKKDEVTFRENSDKTVEIVHTVSARGLNVDTAATGGFAAARAFVAQYSGWNNQVLPHFIGDPQDVVNLTVEETANRIEGIFGVTERYIYDPQQVAGSGNNFIMRYSCDYSRGDDGASVNVKGSIFGGKDGDLSAIKTKFQNTNFYTIASDCYDQFDSGSLINRKLQGSLNENPFNNEVTFNFTYSDNAENAGAVKTIERLVVTEDFETKKVCATLNVNFSANTRDCYSSGWQAVQDANSAYDPYSYVITKLASYGYSGTFENKPVSRSYASDESSKTIEVSYQYCSENDCLHRCFEDLNYSINFSPAIPMYATHPVLDGEGRYIVQNLGFDRRAGYSVQGSVTVSDCCTMEEGKSATISWLNEIQSQYFTGTRKIIESEIIESGNGTRILSFQASWSAEAERVFSPGLF